jgi:UDPglucose 6-dehydrogenase
MKLVVIGCGHVGLVTAAGFAELGHQVIGVENDPHRFSLLRHGQTPFHEPGLDELVAKHLGQDLTFVDDVGNALEGADAAFICVNTPPRPDGRLSLAYVEQVTRTVSEAATTPLVMVEKSTVPVRTARRIVDVLKQEGRQGSIEVASNPEFLREGSAVHDTLRPDRIVVGLQETGGRAEEIMRAVYRPIVDATGCPMIVTDLDTAEMIKHACNSFLSMKISYINAVAELCEKVGADVELVAQGMGLDPRINRHFLSAGVGYGGFCFPKDVSAFISQADEAGVDFAILDAVRTINARQRERIVAKVRHAVWNLEGKTLAVWGLAFKPGTDDLREAPALEVIPALLREGAAVRAYDPAAAEAAKAELPDVEIALDPWAAADGADALVVLTEWPEFADADLERLRDTLRRPVVVDGRNLWSPQRMAELGFTYVSFGRPDVIAGRIERP